MASWTRRDIKVHRVDHVLPVPTDGAELHKALAAAERSYRQAHEGIADDEVLSDDALTITVTDTEVVISYTVEALGARRLTAADLT